MANPKTYLVSYDLIAPGRDYRPLIAAIQSLGGVRVLQSQWVIRVSNTAAQVRDYLRTFMDDNDRILVNDFYEWASRNALVKLDQAA